MTAKRDFKFKENFLNPFSIIIFVIFSRESGSVSWKEIGSFRNPTPPRALGPCNYRRIKVKAEGNTSRPEGGDQKTDNDSS
jgi:hypothetical protein